jgi:hypothetical protein
MEFFLNEGRKMVAYRLRFDANYTQLRKYNYL